MVYEVSVEGTFRATHRVRLPDGSWEPVHGHDWWVRATWRGAELDGHGLLVDFVWAEGLVHELCSGLADSYLNDHPLFAARHASAEGVAELFFERLAASPAQGPGRLWSVRVREAAGCEAEFGHG